MKEHIENLILEINQNKCQVFDIREQTEWSAGFIKKSLLQPLSLLKKGKLSQNADRNKKTYLYCSNGKRVFAACNLLQAMGFKNIIPLKEGIYELNFLGLEIQSNVL